MFATEDDDFPGKSLRSWDSLNFLLSGIKRESALRDEADSHSEKNQVYDQIKIVDLKGGGHFESLFLHPALKLL